MSDDRRYVKVNLSLKDDHPDIFYSDALFATYVRLRMIADSSWPASGDIPGNAKKSSVKVLADRGLVVVTGYSFRVPDIDREREERRDAASIAARSRHGSADSSASGNAPMMPTKAEADQNRPDQLNFDGREDLEAFLLVTRHAPSPKQRRLLDMLLDRHDLTGAKWAADIILRNPNDPIGAVIEADKAWRAERIAEATAAEKPKPQARRCRGLPQSARDILAEMQKIEAEKGAA
jgi:hypothetical protein